MALIFFNNLLYWEGFIEVMNDCPQEPVASAIFIVLFKEF